MRFKLIDQDTGETLLESDKKISTALVIDDEERVITTANRECIVSYLRDPVRGRAEIKNIRSGFGLTNRMEI